MKTLTSLKAINYVVLRLEIYLVLLLSEAYHLCWGQVTDDSQTVLHIDPPDQLEVYVDKMFSHITRLIKERDDFSEVGVEQC